MSGIHRTHININIQICKYIYIHIHRYTYIYIHTCMCAYMPTLSLSLSLSLSVSLSLSLSLSTYIYIGRNDKGIVVSFQVATLCKSVLCIFGEGLRLHLQFATGSSLHSFSIDETCAQLIYKGTHAAPIAKV